MGQGGPPIEGAGDLGSRLHVDAPAGAVPSGTTISVVPRAASERPEELGSVPMARAFFELLPADVRFSAPVTVTRAISFEELGIDAFDPLFDGLLVGSLLTRDASGTWSWLDDVQVGLDLDEANFSVTGTTDYGGPIIADVSGDLLVATEDADVTPVGGTFRVEGQLRVDPTSRGDIVAISGRTSDEAIASAGSGYDVEAFERARGLEYRCLAPGTVTYDTIFSVSDVGEEALLREATGLSGTAVAIRSTGDHTCG